MAGGSIVLPGAELVAHRVFPVGLRSWLWSPQGTWSRICEVHASSVTSAVMRVAPCAVTVYARVTVSGMPDSHVRELFGFCPGTRQRAGPLLTP